MPELNWVYGYPFSYALMAIAAGSLLLFYRSRGLIGNKADAYAKAERFFRGKRRRARDQ
jgi:hypothetical protein